MSTFPSVVVRTRVVRLRHDAESFTYPAKFTPDPDGGFVVTFRDVPEAITQGESIEECMEEAAGALQAAIETYIELRKEIPAPSKQQRGEYLVALPTRTALKAALYLEMIVRRLTNVAFAKVLNVNEKEVRRMLDPNHPTKAEKLEQALAALGKKVEIRVY